jgi:alkylation response protein AidB-like acyl-CoA dehydrogenase
MDFVWSELHEQLKQSAIAFARKVNPPDMIELDRRSHFSREQWNAYGEFGLHGITAPKKHGGLEMDFMSCIPIMEGLGYGAVDHGMLFSINAHLWSCVDPLVHFGSEAQKETYLPRLCRGELIGVHAMTEPDSGSDAFALRTVAVDHGDRFVIDGTKTLISNGDVADVVLVFANVPGPAQERRVTCLLVERGTPGFSCSRRIEKMGLRTSPLSELVFEDCAVPKENVIGRVGLGAAIFNQAMDGERAFILAGQIGRMERELEECVRYAKTRRQFGKRIFDFQSISNLLAEMKVNLETARLMVYKTAWLKNQGQSTFQFSAMTKLHVSECGVKNSMNAMRVHGGYGYTTEMEVERRLRDAMGGLFYSGTSEIMRNIVAELLD